MKTILMTGAAGGVATFVRTELAGRYALRLSDNRAIADLDEDETYARADLTDMDAVLEATRGVDGILHFGGYAVEGPWPDMLQANIIGCYNLFEAARRNAVPRVVFASSNHAVGFYRRSETIGVDVTPRPDTRYGVSKVFGEALGALYADKYGLGVLSIRIGNVAQMPIDVRRLSIWISPRDLAQLVTIGLEHPELRHEIVYGMSDNARAWWDNSNAQRLGYAPQDRSEDYANEVLAAHPERTGDERADMYQGGAFVSAESIPLPYESDGS